MSKSKQKRQAAAGKGASGVAPDRQRRKLLIAGLSGLGTLAIAGGVGYRAGWFGGKKEAGPALSGSPGGMTKALPPVRLPADEANAIQAATDIVSHYTRELRNASSGIHAVRAIGRNFTLDDGSKAVDFLCSEFAAEREVNGRRYVYFPREHEVHDNSFLKTFLEAGVGPDQPIKAGGNRYTLRDLGESAKALFRFDPADVRRHDPVLPEEHLPWGLIAFSILIPPTQPTWTNAYGEKIDLNQVIDRGLADYESVCRQLITADTPPTGESVEYRQKITKYSCYGMHSYYGFFSCYRHGYRENNLQGRLQEMVDHIITRLQRDSEALAQEMEAARNYGQKFIAQMGVGPDGNRRGQGSPPPQIIEVMGLNNFIKMNGHAFEALNYVRLHKLFPISPVQLKRMQVAEKQLHQTMVMLRSYDLDAFYQWDPKFVSDIVIAVSHALRGMKLLGPNNPDTVA